MQPPEFMAGNSPMRARGQQVGVGPTQAQALAHRANQATYQNRQYAQSAAIGYGSSPDPNLSLFDRNMQSELNTLRSQNAFLNERLQSQEKIMADQSKSLKERLSLYQAKVERRDARLCKLQRAILPDMDASTNPETMITLIIEEFERQKGQAVTHQEALLKKEGALELK